MVRRHFSTVQTCTNKVFLSKEKKIINTDWANCRPCTRQFHSVMPNYRWSNRTKKKMSKKKYICIYIMFYLVEQWYTALWIKLKAGALSRWFIPRLGHFWIIHFDNEKQYSSRNLSSPVFITIDDCVFKYNLIQ